MSFNKSGHARATIELLCKVLEENNISFVRAETLRQAKFDKCSVTKSMGQLLFDVVCFCDNDEKNQGGDLLKLRESDLKGEEMIFLKTRLQRWGYLSDSFARLPNNFTTGSRELLLALGWVLHQHNFFDKIIKRRSSPLSQHFMKFVKADAVLNSSEDKFSPNVTSDSHLNRRERIQYHMMLTGKLRLSLRRLYSTCQQLTSLTKTVFQSTEGVHLQLGRSHLTPLEVYVLRYPGSFKKMVQELEKDNLELTHLLEWKQKESIFWEWMESVLLAHIEPGSNQNRASSAASSDLHIDTSLEPTVYLPVPPTITEQIETARDHLRNVILRHESQMSNIEQIVQRKKISTVEVEFHRMQMDKELFEKTLHLRNCGIGEEKKLNESQDNNVDGQSSPQSTLPFSGANKEVLSPYATKTSRREELVKSVNVEISRLKEKIENIQTDLHQMQLQNMQELQGAVNMDETVICIQPRPLKHLYK